MAVEAVMKSQCVAAADGSTGGVGVLQRNPSTGGTGPPAGALKGHSRRFVVACNTNISHSLGLSEHNKENLKFFSRYYLVG